MPQKDQAIQSPKQFDSEKAEAHISKLIEALNTPGSCPTGQEISPQSQYNRDVTAWNVREFAKVRQWNIFIPLTRHPSNGDEERYQRPGQQFENRYITSYTKGLPLSTDPSGNGAFGEVDKDAYCKLLSALQSGDFDDFEMIPLGSVDPATRRPNCPGPNRARNLEDPQGGLAFDLAGADSHDIFAPVENNPTRIGFPPAPKFDSAEQIAEIAENYWMALLRDIAFDSYNNGTPVVVDAATDLSRYDGFTGPQLHNVTPATLFRGKFPGDLIGPYVSQFLVRDVPHGAQRVSGTVRTVPPGKDYMTTVANWLAVQRGCDFDQDCAIPAGQPQTTFIRNGRDLGQFVHVDNAYQGFDNALELLLSGAVPRRCEATPGFGAQFAEGIPYMNPMADTSRFPPSNFQSKNQIGMGTFGPQHVKDLLFEAVKRALNAVWYQKWFVHRRLRPEAFAGRIHFHLENPGRVATQYPFNATEFAKLGGQANPNSILGRVFAHNTAQNGGGQGTYLLPMAFAEGSPLHPSYGQGHATVAGACITILKAFFRDTRFVDFAVPSALPSGSVLRIDAAGNPQAYGGADINQITVHGELNKLASNIGLGRDFAGVHYRSDYADSVVLGEQVAINLLEDYYSTFNEKFFISFTKLNGAQYVLSKNISGTDFNRM